MKELIEKIKQKRELKELPDSIVKKSLEISKGDVKKSRTILHKYFGVFLTNKILKPKELSDWQVILKTHKSSQKRDYEKLYSEIFKERNSFNSVVDLGCGMNGFSLLELHYACGTLEYWGIEASGQIVDLTNSFFDKFCEGYNAHAVWLDLFDYENIKKIIKQSKKPRVIFMFQVVDALEAMQKNYTKKLIIEISKELNKEDLLVLSYSTKSLSGREKFYSERKWLSDFLKENFVVKNNFEMFDEKFIVCLKI